MQLPSSVQVTEPTPGFPVYVIRHPKCHARVALHGAHVMEWQPTSAPKPVLYLSPTAVLREGKAIRGGIPICWPWFNAHPDDNEKPSHGVARTRFWELESIDEYEEGIVIVMTTGEGALHAKAKILLGDTLRVELDTHNAGESTIAYGGALHSYFSIEEITAISIGGLDATQYLDTVGEPTTRKQSGPVIFEGEVDRIYDSEKPARLSDPGMDRIIWVEKEGSPSTVVWNPWVEKAEQLGDLPDTAYRDFVCIEAAIANDVQVELEPKATHRLATHIRLDV